jgi:thiol-disulfide isomerase/thioredoxin
MAYITHFTRFLGFVRAFGVARNRLPAIGLLTTILPILPFCGFMPGPKERAVCCTNRSPDRPPPGTDRRRITFHNLSAGKVGFYFYTRTFDPVEFYMKPGETHTVAMEGPSWIIQLTAYQTPYYLDLDGDTLSVTTDEKGIARLVPVRNKEEETSNELNAFEFISHRVAKSENEILLEILHMTGYQDINKIIVDRYNRAREQLGDYRRNHTMSKKFELVAADQLLLNKYSYQLLWIGNSRIKIPVPASYKIYLDSIYRVRMSDTLHSSMGCPVYQADYSFFLYHCRQVISATGASSDSIYARALAEIQGRQRDKILFFILKDRISSSPKDQISSSVSVDNGLVTRFFYDCRDEGFRQYIGSMLENNRIKQSVVSNDALLTQSRQQVNFDDMLKAGKGKILYIDTWASWCAPCRAEMPASEKLRAAYAGRPIGFVYISIDKDLAAWKLASDQERLNEVNANYLLVNFERSDFKRQYDIATIPRYILIDKNGRPLKVDALRPGDPALRSLLDKLLKE